MSFGYTFFQDAQEEYEAAIIWYAERSIIAAENFILAFDHVLGLICANPERWRNEYKEYHELGLKKYPFTLVYEIDWENNLVTIVSVFHNSRNPLKKYKK
ncbi:MAG: type II toxin-antitoxin system RelE/ParE family toxin [Bacteroidota bacterium]